MIPLHWLRATGAGLLSASALWLAGDLLHSLLIRWRSRRAPPYTPAPPFTLNPDADSTVLLIHGFADSPSVFTKLAPLLADAGHHVRALRLDGFDLPPRRMACITAQHWRDNINVELAALRRQNPNRPVWLAGHSLGGTLAFDTALRHADDIAGLILIAPLIEPSNARSPLLTSRQWFNLLDRILLFTRAIESRLPADLHEPRARQHYRTGKFIHRSIYRALFETTDAIARRASDWHGPLLMALAPDDQIINSASSEQFFHSAVNAHPKTLVHHPGAGHVLPLDVTHARLAEQIHTFIAQSRGEDVAT